MTHVVCVRRQRDVEAVRHSVAEEHVLQRRGRALVGLKVRNFAYGTVDAVGWAGLILV